MELLKQLRSFNSKSQLIEYYDKILESGNRLVARGMMTRDIGLNGFVLKEEAFKDFPIVDNSYADVFLQFIAPNLVKSVNELKADRYTRRAVFNTFDFKYEDLPSCILFLQAIYRDDKMHLIAYIRSSDYRGKFSNDIAIFIEILKNICRLTNSETGDVIVLQGSFHYYEGK